MGKIPSQSKPDGFASSPERGSFIGANRQMQKAPPFGGAGERSETERVGSLPEGAGAAQAASEGVSINTTYIQI